MTTKEHTHPLVSICIPLYNASHYIEETLTKVFEQTYRPIEIIVVDDHSTDNSFELVEKFQSKETIRLFKNPKKGGNAARNYAFQKSHGDYIKFLDADDYCSENMISAQMNRILKDGTPDTLVFSPYKVLYFGKFIEHPRSIDNDYKPAMELVVDTWKLNGFNITNGYLVSSHLVKKSGGWGEHILKNQDGEFFARVAAVADQALSVPEEFAIWRQTEKGVSFKYDNDAISSNIDTLDIISNLLLDYKNTPEMRTICGQYIGAYVFGNYPYIKHLMPKIHSILNKIDAPLILPNRKMINLFISCFGWKKGLSLIHRLKQTRATMIRLLR